MVRQGWCQSEIIATGTKSLKTKNSLISSRVYENQRVAVKWVNTFIARLIQAVHAKIAGLHVVLRGLNSGTESIRELFKCSKDSTHLPVCSEIFFSVLGFALFCEWRYKWRTFRPPWPTSPVPGPKLLDVSISLKLLLETKLKSESCDTLGDLRGLVSKVMI